MRIGVATAAGEPTAGGAFSFQGAISAALANSTSEHTFPFLSPGDLSALACPGRERAANGAENGLRRRSFKSVLQRALKGTLSATIGAESPPRATPDATCNAAPAVSTPPALDAVWFLYPAYMRLQIPYFYTVWDLQHRRQPVFPEVSQSGWTWEERESCYREMLPRATRIFTGTAVGKDEIVRFYGIHPDTVVVIPIPYASCEESANLDAMPPAAPIERPFIFYPGQFWPHKNHICVLYAVRQMIDANLSAPDVVFTGADKGNLAYIRAAAEDFRIADRVHFLGFVPAATLTELYKTALALVFPTFFGPDNIPPLEAFSLGCPVIASDVPGACEQLGDAALLFDPKHPQSLVQALTRLSGDPVLRETLVNNGLRRAASRTPEKYVEAVIKVVDDFAAVRRCWGAQYVHM